MRTTWKPFSNKTKLTLLLSLTFLFLFSGSSIVIAEDYYDGTAAIKRGDWKTGYRILLPLAEQGHGYSQYLVGLIYHYGRGVLQDQKEAVKWMRLAVENGNTLAQNELGKWYAKGGLGVPQDNVLGHKWLSVAWYYRVGKYQTIKNLENKMTPSQIEKSHQLFDQYMVKMGEKSQKEFINIVLSYRDKYNNSKNEIKKTLQRKKRFGSFKKFFEQNLIFHHWIGKISSMDTNRHGDASVGIIIESKGGLVAELAEKERDLNGVIFAEGKVNWLVPGGIVLVNNRQKIKMDDDLFDKIAEMEVGDKVVFSGRFELHPEDEIGRSKGWHIHTANQTEKGAMTSPVFLVGYRDIKKTNK